MSFVKTLECVSPIDGSVYATRQSLSLEDALAKLGKAKLAQQAWQQRPLGDRIAIVMKGVEQLGAMTDALVTELAWQMGRPVRYGGEFGGVNERNDQQHHHPLLHAASVSRLAP